MQKDSPAGEREKEDREGEREDIEGERQEGKGEKEERRHTKMEQRRGYCITHIKMTPEMNLIGYTTLDYNSLRTVVCRLL